MRKAIELLIAIVFLVAAGCSKEEPEELTQADPQFLKALNDAQKKVGEIKKQYEKIAKEAGPLPNSLGDLLKDPFGAGSIEKKIEAMKEATKNVVVTDYDRAGFDLYCKGAFASAARAFEASKAEKPGRPFPDYFLGCIAFEKRDYRKAADYFEKVIAADKTASSAHLFKRLSQLCQEKRRVGTPDLLKLFYQACYETEEKLELEREGFSFAEIFMPKLLSDPVLFKVQELLMHVSLGRIAGVARDYKTAKTSSEKLMLGLMLTSDETAEKFVQHLAQECPNDRDVQVFAFLYKYYGPAGDERRKNSKTFSRELDAVRKLDPENGTLMLLAIREIPPEKIEVEERTIYTYTPLSEAEKALLHGAARAERFETCFYYKWDEDHSYHQGLFGGFSNWARMGPRRPNVFGHLLNMKRRTTYTTGKLLDEGKDQAALKLHSDLKRVALMVNEEHDCCQSRLIAESIVEGSRRKVLTYSAGHGSRKTLLDTCLDEKEDALMHGLELRVTLDHVMALAKLPIPLFLKAYLTYDTSREIRQELYRWMIGTPYAKSAVSEPIEDLKRFLEFPHRRVPSYVYDDVIFLGDTRNKQAISRLEKLTDHKDPLLAHLSRKALAAIKGKGTGER